MTLCCLPKLKFFQMASSKLYALLRGFQTKKPMVPFITDKIGDLAREEEK